MTLSLFELFVMSRLHIHAKNMNLVLESDDVSIPHNFFKNTQEKLNVLSVTHWTTRFTLNGLNIHFMKMSFSFKKCWKNS